MEEATSMLDVLQVMSVVLVAVAMAPALAHLLELPGKLRLSRETYLAVQPIYYPGFTISAGIGETAGPISTAVLLFLSPAGSAAFWLRLVALLGLIGMQAVYWIVTHPEASGGGRNRAGLRLTLLPLRSGAAVAAAGGSGA
jgi:hypothetical protein